MTHACAPASSDAIDSSDLFSVVFHQNPEAIALSRADSGVLVQVNNAWLAITGYVGEEVLGRTTVELGLWGAPENREKAMAPVLTGEAHCTNFEATLLPKGGGHRLVAVKATRFMLGGVEHLLVYVRDVTGQRDSARGLRERLDFIEKFTSRLPGMLYQFRLRADGTAHFPYATAAMLDVFGVAPDTVRDDARAALVAVHPEDAAGMWQSIRASGAAGTPWRHEFRVRLGEGVVRWMYGDSLPERQEDGSVLWHGFITDMTERKREHDELKKTRELMAQKAQGLRIALDNMSQGIVTMDTDAAITLYNQRFLELLELPQVLMVPGVNGTDLLRFQVERGDFGADYELVEPAARAVLAQGIVRNAPLRYLRKTRSGRTLEISTRPLPGGGVVRTFEDVTHFVEAQAALLESESRFRSLTALSSDWYWEQDEHFRFVRIDGHGHSDAVAGKGQQHLGSWESGAIGVSPEQWAAHRATLLAHQTFQSFEFQRVDEHGVRSWVSISGLPIIDDLGRFRGYRGIGRDITEHKRREDETLRLAFYDTLTGMPNRRLLLDRLALALNTSARSQQHGALLFIDLDNFKDLNDTLGHDIGDQLLERVAKRLVTCIRQGDTVARLGGDEFVVMLEDLSPAVADALAQVEAVGEKVLSVLNQPYDLPGRMHYSTPSIGVTLFNGHRQGVDELLKRADLAMYQSKAAGRNTLRFFDPDMQAAVAARAALEVDLRHGLEQGEMMLCYQTIVDEQRRTLGVEALVRWAHPQRGIVSPAEFIAVAEQTGLILPLGEWVLRTACQQLVDWSGQVLTRDLSIAVNVSARQFRHPGFASQILAILAETGANPLRLKLELTESLLLSDVQDAIRKMEELRSSGVGFALDDFGTGYSSLSYLKRLPLDQLKIDHSFVRDVLNDPNDAAIARTVVALAHSLGLSVVAEGVETEGQLDFLMTSGCRAFQGYLFARPVPADALQLHPR